MRVSDEGRESLHVEDVPARLNVDIDCIQLDGILNLLSVGFKMILWCKS